MGLGGDSIDTALTVFYFTAFNFWVVTHLHFNPRSKHTVNFYPLNNLLRTLSLQKDAHDLAISNSTVLDSHRIVGVRYTVNAARTEVIKLSVWYRNVTIQKDASWIVIIFVTLHSATGEVD